MPRYFTRSKDHSPVGDDDWFEPGLWHIPCVPEQEAVDTGLITETGGHILRAPNPIGFGRDDEW